MANVDYLGQGVLQAAVLPARAAYLISADRRDGFVRAVQEASTRWGGMTEPIVPVERGGRVRAAWQQFLSFAAVDGLVNVDVATADAETVGKRLQLPVVPLRSIDHYGTTAATCHPTAIAGAINPEQPAVCAPSDAPLWEITAGGALTEAHAADWPLAGFVPVPTARRTLMPDEIGRGQFWGTTLIDATVAQFGEHAAQNGPFSCSAIVWLTKPDSLKDCLYFWNLRALRPLSFRSTPMAILPDPGTEHWLMFGQHLAGVLSRPAEFSPDVIIGSLSVPEARRHVIAETLGLVQSTEEPSSKTVSPPPPPRTPPFTYLTGLDVRGVFLHPREYGLVAHTITQLFREATLIEVVSPVTFAAGGRALVRLSGGPLDNYPRRAVIARRIEPNGVWRGAALQLSVVAQDRMLLSVGLPDERETVELILNEVTRTHALSDKGRLGIALAAQVDPAALRVPGAYEAIHVLTTPRSKELLSELKRARTREDAEVSEIAAQWGGRAERRYRTAEQMKDKVGRGVVDVVEDLASLRWMERGLPLDCTHCTIRSFVPLSDVIGPARCPACGNRQRYRSDGKSISVVYRLNGFVDRASDQGCLPPLITVAALAAGGTAAYLLPGINVEFADGSKGEVDVFGTHNGRIVAGEIKTSAGAFTKVQMRRDIEISARLGADVHVMACIDSLSNQVVDQARVMASKKGLELLVLSGPMLRPTQ